MKLLKKPNEIKCRCMKCNAEWRVKNKDWKYVVADYPQIIYKNNETMSSRIVGYKRFSIRCPICGDYVIISMEKNND